MKQLLFLLVRSQLHGTSISEEQSKAIKDHKKALYELAVPQGFGPVVGQALADNGLLDEDELSFVIRAKTMQVFKRQSQQDFEFYRICDCLRKAEIGYVPLKGAVIRKFYPQGWMRTSSDIDILVKEESLPAAVEVLKKELGYTQPHDREYHDVALYSPTGVLLELHFSLKENNAKLDRGLSRVWEFTKSVAGEPYRLELTPEFFVFHVVAHCAYHFMSSGCGGKAVLDLWLLKHKMGYDEEKVKELCAECGLEQFYLQIMKLAQVWFSQEESTPFLEKMGDYILNAGFGGSEENAVAAGVLKRGNKGKYIAGRLFLPYDMLKEYYPILHRHKWLMPACQVRRLFGGLKRRRIGSVMRELKNSSMVSNEELKNTEALFSDLGLI